MRDRLQVFTDWLIEYIDEPIPAALIQIAEGRPAADAVSIGRSFALTAVAGAVKGILRVPLTWCAPLSDENEQEIGFAALFGSIRSLREAGAGGSNPLTPTSGNNDITDN